jgi:hypothetical protein
MDQMHRTSSLHKDDSIAKATKAQGYAPKGYKDFKSSAHPFDINTNEELPAYTPYHAISQPPNEKMSALFSYRDQECASEANEYSGHGFEHYDQSEQSTVVHFVLNCLRNTVLNIVYWVICSLNRLIGIFEKVTNAVLTKILTKKMMVACIFIIVIYSLIGNAAVIIHAIGGSFAYPCC